MDLAMVKQEQGETLRKYMRRFFNKRATVVDVTDKEVINLLQDGLYHCRTFEDFSLHCPSSITKLKDMITSWADEEDKANAKYDAIRGKSKQNAGGSNNNNRDQGGRNNNYSGPNRKRKPDNTVAAIQRPVKDNSKKTSGGFKDLLKEKCLWNRTNIGISLGFLSIGYGSPAVARHMSISFSRRKPLFTSASRSLVFTLDFFHSLFGFRRGGEVGGVDPWADPAASSRDLFFLVPVFMLFDGEDFILQMHRVFTRIHSGASLEVSSGGARGSAA
jgi:hypothetical protein